MTGRDLILYILQNNLEDEPIFKNGRFVGFLTIEETAVKLNCGTATVNTYIKMGQLKYIKVGDRIMIPDVGLGGSPCEK